MIAHLGLPLAKSNLINAGIGGGRVMEMEFFGERHFQMTGRKNKNKMNCFYNVVIMKSLYFCVYNTD
jgi:hypothetical protein